MSLLPLWVLHRVSDVLYYLAYYVIGYRKKVVSSNVDRAFPEKSAKERQEIVKGFYRNFSDVIMESVKTFSIGEAELKRRFVMKDVEQLTPHYEQGKSIIGMISHMANYEWMIACDLYLKHRGLGIITPLSNAFFHKKIVDSRSQFGTKVVPKAEIKAYMAEKIEPTVYFFGSDQSPHRANSAYWTNFFGINTAVQYGAEKFAKQYDWPVYHFKISRIKRGYYQVTCEELELHPVESPYGEILDKYCEQLEKHIRQYPAQWLWSHRRWKHS